MFNKNVLIAFCSIILSGSALACTIANEFLPTEYVGKPVISLHDLGRGGLKTMYSGQGQRDGKIEDHVLTVLPPKPLEEGQQVVSCLVRLLGKTSKVLEALKNK